MTVCPSCGKDSGAKPNPRVDYMCLRYFFKFRTTPAPPGDPCPALPPKLPARRSRYVVQPTRTSVSGRLGPMALRPSKRQSRATVSYPDRSRRTQ